MIKETSREAYQSIQDTLNIKQKMVLGVFQIENSPLSNEQVKEILGWEINRITPRVKELTDAGLISVCGHSLSKAGRKVEVREVRKQIL